MLERIKAARDRRIAHLDREFHLGGLEIASGVNLEELNEIADYLGTCFNAMTVEDHSVYVVVEMDGEGLGGGALGYVLDCVARSERPRGRVRCVP